MHEFHMETVKTTKQLAVTSSRKLYMCVFTHNFYSYKYLRACMCTIHTSKFIVHNQFQPGQLTTQFSFHASL